MPDFDIGDPSTQSSAWEPAPSTDGGSPAIAGGLDALAGTGGDGGSLEAGGGPKGAIEDLFGRMYGDSQGEGAGAGPARGPDAGAGFEEEVSPWSLGRGPEKMLPPGQSDVDDHMRGLRGDLSKMGWDVDQKGNVIPRRD